MLNLKPVHDPAEGFDRALMGADQMRRHERGAHEHYRDVHQLILQEINLEDYTCKLNNDPPCNITVSASSDRIPSLVVIRDRNGVYISGVSKSPGARSFHIRSDALPILRSRDKSEVISHVAKYIQVMSQLKRQDHENKDVRLAKAPKSRVSLQTRYFAISCIAVSLIAGFFGVFVL